MQEAEKTFDDLRNHINRIEQDREAYSALVVAEILKTYINEFEKAMTVYGKDLKISKPVEEKV